MSRSDTSSSFVSRFENVLAQIRRVQLTRIFCLSLLFLTCGLALLTLFDYWFEARWEIRAAGLAAIAVAGTGLAALGLARFFRHWNRPKTAVEIERRFPQLGQSVRTTVQFSGRDDEKVRSEGIEPNLVSALENETSERTRPLDIDTIVPVRRMKTAAVLLGAAVVLMLAAVAIHWEWRVAAQRALLGNLPYTELTVSPGNTLVEAGNGLVLSLELNGRTNRKVVLYSRPTGQTNAAWTQREILSEEIRTSKPRSVKYEVLLQDIQQPLEFHVIAGPAVSDVFRVDVRYPINIADFKVELTPPEYTGLKPKTVEEGNLNVIDGTKAKFQITLDRPPRNASLVLSNLLKSMSNKEGEPNQQTIPLTIEGTTLSAELELTEDKTYSIAADSEDGTQLAENSFRIRVRKDQPPRVSFEEPNEALEVHSLAEILMRIRVQDDFGLTRSGIVFEVNNEEEYPLLTEDFEQAAREFKETGKLTPQTRAGLEKVLPLEFFQLTQKDSIAYYAFAEDNFPKGPKRTVTDLRFIDIRPFKRTYRLLDPMMPDMQGQPLATLEELIARQRFTLNRTLRLERESKRGKQPDLKIIDGLMEFETKLATATRELAEVLEANDVDGSDLLFQAVESMLASVDSLSVGKYENAVLQEKDALRYLIEGRNRINIALLKKNMPALQRIRSFDRIQAQKLRRPENDEEDVEQIVERLNELAEEEEFVYKTLAGIIMENNSPSNMQQTPQETEASGGNGNQGTKGKGKKGKKGDKKQSQQNKKNENGKNKKQKGTGKDKEGSKEAGGSNKDQNSASGSAGNKPGMTREEIRDRQIDLALEAHDLDRILQNLQGISDLARERIAEAAKSADEVSGALNRGDTEKAAQDARKTAGMVRELARQVEALLLPEAAQKIAQARNISNELAMLQRQLGDRVNENNQSGSSPSQADKRSGKSAKGSSGKQNEDSSEPSDVESSSQNPGETTGKSGTGNNGKNSDRGKGAGDGQPDSDEQRAAELADQAARYAETGKTLEDLLESIIQSENASDLEASRRVEELAEGQEVPVTVTRMQNLPPAILAGRRQDVRAETRDIADRMEVFSRKLDELHRSIIMPRVDQLTVLEERAARMQDKLDRLQTEGQITQWHREAGEFIGELEENFAGRTAGNKLQKAMRKAGWGTNKHINGWNRSGGTAGYYNAPGVYHSSLQAIIEELQAQIEELVVGDHLVDADEAVPPQYKHLVERYYRVLSSDSGKR